MVKLTPGMKQYMDVKNANPDCIILFRMGDFYETFFEDAKTVARELEITLTSRGKGETRAPLAGIPYHAIEPYLAKLVKKGYKVGIVEQIEDPKKAIGLVKRDLVRIITPGTVVDSSILEKNKNNYILSIIEEDGKIGVSFCDISTGEFLCATIQKEKIDGELKRLNPAEIIFPSSTEESKLIESLKHQRYVLNDFEDRHFYFDKANANLKEHFDVINLEGFGIKSKLQIASAGALLSYLKETQMNALTHINKIGQYLINDYMFLDTATIRNLELLQNIIHKGEEATLLSVVDKTITPMGKRLIKKWVTSPLVVKNQIEKRLESVEELKEKIIQRQDLIEELKDVYDLERLIGRVAYGNANPKDLVSLGVSLEHIPKIKENLSETKSELLNLLSNFPEMSNAQTLIKTSIKDEPSIVTREGNIIREGYNAELDELRDLTIDAKTYLSELEEKEKERTNIKSLKIKYNKVIGYYIDITKPNLHLVPEDYIRKQSQLNSERFITEELKELESKILGAQERIYELEYNLFIEILEKLSDSIVDIQKTAKNIAELDCIVSLAQVAQERGYTRPRFNEEGIYDLKKSRHPVIEAFSDVDFIPNDCALSNHERTMIITGPNMAGKSTYLRQTALISLLAQMGSFVPAEYANLPIIDRVFSRIGAYDDLVNQQSTFMVEMNETANILNNASSKSFVILDEIGRGTSTFDGVSLAWAIAEYLNNKVKCKTLFATHYHHLNNMSDKFEGITNYNISVDETEDKIIFLRKIVKGGTDKSYGIQVAKLAGLPNQVITNAKEIMHQIEIEDEIAEKIIREDREEDINKIIEERVESLYENHKEDSIEIIEPEFKTIETYDLFEHHEENKHSKIDRLEKEINEIKSLLRNLAPKETKKENKPNHENLQKFF